MPGSAQPEDRLPSADKENAIAVPGRTSAIDALGQAGGSSSGSRAIEETELDSALQLLVERAQYITGATGAALALPERDEMVCRASAGASAPGLGARLQVRSGLTAESIAHRQLLRCDNAESDPRVNLEACRALGIASIVVLPLLRRDGEVRGLFELFSDHPYAFEERDLIALERMADLTLTALDLSEQRLHPVARRESGKPSDVLPDLAKVSSAPNEQTIPAICRPPEFAEGPPAASSIPSLATAAASAPAAVPDAMHRVQKCNSCGFPVSEGRTLCLDCEKKNGEQSLPKRRDETAPRDQERSADAESAAQTPGEFAPDFLTEAGGLEESWFAKHGRLLVLAILVVVVLVAVVILRSPVR